MQSLTRAVGWRVSIRLIGIAMLLLAAPLAGAVAQHPAPLGTIAGVVTDSAGKPIQGVEVLAAGRANSARSDTGGHYRIADIRAGKAILTFRHFGFTPQSVPAVVRANATSDVSVALEPLVQELPGMLVMERDERARKALQGFYHRMQSMTGFFITRREIDERNPSEMSDMLRLMPGAVLRPSDIGGRSELRFARATLPGRDCPPQYYVDGIMSYGLNIDDIEPADVEGIEVYSGASRVPPQFNNSRIGTAICGVVLIWTRVPGT